MCCYEQFKNEFVMHLSRSSFTDTDIKRITELLNLAAYNYDLSIRDALFNM